MTIIHYPLHSSDRSQLILSYDTYDLGLTLHKGTVHNRHNHSKDRWYLKLLELPTPEHAEDATINERGWFRSLGIYYDAMIDGYAYYYLSDSTLYRHRVIEIAQPQQRYRIALKHREQFTPEKVAEKYREWTSYGANTERMLRTMKFDLSIFAWSKCPLDVSEFSAYPHIELIRQSIHEHRQNLDIVLPFAPLSLHVIKKQRTLINAYVKEPLLYVYVVPLPKKSHQIDATQDTTAEHNSPLQCQIYNRNDASKQRRVTFNQQQRVCVYNPADELVTLDKPKI